MTKEQTNPRNKKPKLHNEEERGAHRRTEPNEEKDRKTQRQETEVAAGREKVGEGAIRKIATKPKPAEEKYAQKKRDKK